MSEHRSVWRATAPATSHPGLRDDLDVDVAVVGGGLVGLTTALLAQRDGARVAVIEAARVGSGTTGGTTGKVTSQHSLCYDELLRRAGEETAQRYADANQEAIEIVARLADETGADCRFERAPAYVYSTRAEDRPAIEAECEAALRLGLPAVLTTDVDLPFPVASALRFDDQAHFHAGRYCEALARAIGAGGGTIVEQTRARGVDEHDGGVTVHTDAAEVRAHHAVVATLLPITDPGLLFARARPSRSYAVAARLRGDAPAGMHISVGEPTRSTRPWVEHDRRGLVVAGEGHPTGEGAPTPARWGELERWTREHFDVESFAYRWSAQDYLTPDGIPFAGRAARSEHTYVATGFKKWGITNGTAAATLLAALVAGRDHPARALYDPARIGDPGAIAQTVGDNIGVAAHLVGDRVGRLGARSLSELDRGEGAIVRVDDRALGAYRDPEGHVHAVSLSCTHLGCTVQWNGAERSWDCPCHGSRFGVDGDVLAGPAVRELERIEVRDPATW